MTFNTASDPQSREMLTDGTPIPEEFTRPEIADILREAANTDKRPD
ncbi:hypothetical protein ACFLSW_06325 [Candidatus Bipolaricaulota bacterium]